MDKEEYSKFIQRFVKERYSYSNFDQKSLHDRRTDSTSLSQHKTMKSYGLGQEEMKLKTNIAKWAKTAFSHPIDIKPFPTDYLESVIVLEPPKEIVSYYNPANAPIVKPTAPKVRAPKASRQQAKAPRHSIPEVASLYADEREPSSKKFKSNDDYMDDKDEGDDVSMYQASSRSVDSRGPPPGLYPAINNIREYFWDLEYEPQSVSFAFFAVINTKNCHEFALSSFAEESCCLAVINDRIRTAYYHSAEEFEADFRKMFNNIVTYYPRTHPAYARAVELSQTFETMWSAARQQIYK